MPAQPSLRAVERLVGGHVALRAAVTSGILDRLSDQPATASALAVQLDLDTRLTDALLSTLAVAELVSEDEQGRFHAPKHLTTVVGLVEDHYTRLPVALRDPDAATRVDTLHGAGDFYPEVVAPLARSLAEPAAVAARHLARPGLRVLDVGAGGAPWSLAILRHESSCRILAVDVPEVLPATREIVTAAGLADRYAFVAGDVFEFDLASVHDLVIVGNLCHLFPPERAALLLGRLAGALAADGTLAVIDLPTGAATDDGLATTVYRLGLMLRTAAGGLHTRKDYLRWLSAAGLGDLDHRPIDTAGLELFTGRRRRPAGPGHTSST